MKVCVLIPVHNEGKEIARIVGAVRAQGLDVIVVDDGSEDDSGRLAEEQGALVLRNPAKQGKGASLQKGFAHILQHPYDGVVTMDGDGQHDVDDLPLFLAKAAGQPKSVVNGTRMGEAFRMPLVRRVTNRMMSWMISSLCGQKIEDTQCGFRYISCDVLRQIHLTASDFEIETEVLMKTSRLGYPILSVPIKTIYRDETSKIRPIKDTIRFFAYIFREMKNRKI